jgi:hypothetical protein
LSIRVISIKMILVLVFGYFLFLFDQLAVYFKHMSDVDDTD